MSTEAQTAHQPESITKEPILAIFQDGPQYQPNGHLLVEILRQDRVPHRFACRVVKVISATGRTAQPGDIVYPDALNLHLHWAKPT